MKWFEQSATEYESMVGRQLLASPGGVKWYGAYIILKQIIAQNMNDDMSTWGYVEKGETKATLAEKCGLSIDEFRLFITFCNDRFIFEQRNEKLFCQAILEEKNRYAKIQERKVKRLQTAQNAHSAHTDTHSAQNKVHNHIPQTHTHILPKGNGADAPKEPLKDRRDENIEFLLSLFKETWGYEPTDKKPRFVAHNFIQNIQSYLKKERSKEPTPEIIQAVLRSYVTYLKTQSWAANIQKLETMKLKFSLFKAAVADKENHAKNDST